MARLAFATCVVVASTGCTPGDEPVEAAASHRSTRPAQSAEAEQRPAWPRYAGRPTPPKRSESRVEGARTRVLLPAALQGDVVRHDLVIHNDRDVAMSLSNVKSCRGCVLDGWPRTIPPGAEGRISIVVLTDSRGGDTVRGTVVAESDDPARPRIEVDVELEVKEFAALEPYRVWLKGRAGEPIVATCTVVPNEAYPFEITDIKLARGRWLDIDWQPTTREGRPAYEITLENTRTKPGPYQDILFVQTSHPDRPELKIRVEGRIEPGA